MKHLLTGLLLLFTLSLHAQEFDIRSFSPIPNDLSARKEVRRTVNDEPCALVKVVTNIRGMQFESNSGIVDVEHKEDGYWVYVWPRERRIKLMASGYLSQDVQLPEPAKELMVYELVVAKKGMSIAQSDLVRITFRINEADAYIAHGSNAPVMTTGNNAVYDLPRGPQRFTFRKAGFDDKVLNIEVDQPKVIDVALVPGSPSERIKLPGFVIVTSEPSGAEVFLNDQRVGQTPYQGRQLPGTYNLALRNHLYHDHEERFELAEGGTATLPLVKLKPRFGFVNLSSEPTGAEVYLDGKMVGKSPIQGLQVESGSHSLSLRSPAYHELKESFSMTDGESKNLNFSLRPAFGTLIITSDPPGAEVFLDEQRAGSTPFRENRQPSGTYNLRLELPMHSTERSQVEVNDEQRTERFFALSKNYGTLAIESDGADIYLDGKKIGAGTFDHRSAPGSYTLIAKKDRHDDDSQEVFLTIGQVETITLKPTPRTGVLSIMTEPFEASGAEIWIDGKKTEYKTPAVVELLEGEYEVTLKALNFNDLSFKTKIVYKGDIHKELTMSDERRASRLEISVSDETAGAKVLLDGGYLWLIAPGVIDVRPGKYILTAQKKGYKDFKKVVSIKPEQTTKIYFELKSTESNPKKATVNESTSCLQEITKVVEIKNPHTGRTWMDRNLGAQRAAKSPKDANAYGYLYQWGRSSDGHQCRESQTTSILSSSETPKHGNFILSNSERFDWRSSQNSNLWQGKLAINNPCPTGFRLPTDSEWDEERKSWPSNSRSGAFESPLKLPAAGNRGYNSGEISGVGNQGYYWSSSVSGGNARYLLIDYLSAGMSDYYRARGYSVRCIKD